MATLHRIQKGLKHPTLAWNECHSLQSLPTTRNTQSVKMTQQSLPTTRNTQSVKMTQQSLPTTRNTQSVKMTQQSLPTTNTQQFVTVLTEQSPDDPSAHPELQSTFLSVLPTKEYISSTQTPTPNRRVPYFPVSQLKKIYLAERCQDGRQRCQCLGDWRLFTWLSAL